MGLAAAVAMCYAFAVSLLLAWLVRAGYDMSTLGSAGRGSVGLVPPRLVTRQPESAEEEDTVR